MNPAEPQTQTPAEAQMEAQAQVQSRSPQAQPQSQAQPLSLHLQEHRIPPARIGILHLHGRLPSWGNCSSSHLLCREATAQAWAGFWIGALRRGVDNMAAATAPYTAPKKTSPEPPSPGETCENVEAKNTEQAGQGYTRDDERGASNPRT